MQAALLVGGIGTRLRPLTDTVPKPMVPVAGRPFLEYVVGLMKASGVTDFVFCVGYLGEVVEDHFGRGEEWGVRIRYSRDGKRPLGPAGALKKAEPLLAPRFFVSYGDGYLRADYGGMMRRLVSSTGLGVMAAYRNRNRHGRSDIELRGRFIVAYDKSGTRKDLEWINYGVAALRRESLSVIPAGRACGDEEFYGELVERRALLAFRTRKRFYEIGSPEALSEFERFVVANGIGRTGTMRGRQAEARSGTSPVDELRLRRG